MDIHKLAFNTFRHELITFSGCGGVVLLKDSKIDKSSDESDKMKSYDGNYI